MARPVKIKRYRNSVGGHNDFVMALRKYLPPILGALLLIALGFLVGKPIINLISGLGDSSSRPQGTSSVSEEAIVPGSVSSQERGRESGSRETGAKRIYYYSEPTRLDSESEIDATIKAAVEAGANRLVFNVKDRDGYLLYPSKNQYGSQLLSEIQIDLTLLRKKCREAGIVPVARIYSFRDNMISTVERSTAVMYRDTDIRWLDSSAALGGKAWANPASSIMRQYLTDIADEIMTFGINEMIFAGFSTPTGNSLADRGFGATEEQILGHMRTLINTLRGRISARGGWAAWEFEYSAVIGGDWRQYIVHPYRLEAENIIVTTPSDRDIRRTAATLLKDRDSGEFASACIWVQGSREKPGKELGDYFVN